MSNPNTAVFPGAVPTNSTLPVANDALFTTLIDAIDNSQTSSINLGLGGFNVPTIVVIDNEIILVVSLSGSTITSCIRGFAGSTANSHAADSSVLFYIVSYNNNQIIAELVAICTALGTNLVNVISSGQAAGGDLSGTYPNPNVATVGGASAGSIASAVGASHPANSDIATTVNTVTFSSTPNFDLNLGGIQFINLAGNVISSTISNLQPGQVVRFIIKQDGTGGRTFSWPASFHGAMLISVATANQVSVQEFFSWNGTTLWATGPGLTSS